jgi:hypothetical protein
MKIKSILLLAPLFAVLAPLQAQQAVPRDELLRVAAYIVSLDLKQMLNTPIPTDPDVKRPVALREGERGVMALPESKLADGLARQGREVVPVGQLWLRKLVPQCGSQAVRPEQLQLVSLTVGDRTESAVLCALGVSKDAGGKLQLLVYGKGKDPLLELPLKSISAAQENPIELSAAVQGNSAVLTLRLLGKHEASFTLVGE